MNLKSFNFMDKFKDAKTVTVFGFNTGERENLKVVGYNEYSITLEGKYWEFEFFIQKNTNLFRCHSPEFPELCEIVPPGIKNFLEIKRIYDIKYAKHNLKKLEISIPSRMESIELLKRDLKISEELLEYFLKEEKKFRDFLEKNEPQEEEGF